MNHPSTTPYLLGSGQAIAKIKVEAKVKKGLNEEIKAKVLRPSERQVKGFIER